METSKASLHKSHVLARVLCLASAVALLWFLYWVGFDLVVWNRQLFQVDLFNCVGAILSGAIFLGGIRFAAVKNMVDRSIEPKQESAVTLKWLQLEREEEIKIGMRSRLLAVNDELTELRRQCREIVASLKAPK